MTVPVGTYNTDLAYNLPPAVRGLQEGWMKTFEASAVVSALVAAIESQLLSTFRSGGNGIASQVLDVLAYIVLLSAISLTMSSMVLTQEFSVIGLRSARQPSSPVHDGTAIFDGSSAALMSRFNGKRTVWQYLVWYLMLTQIVGFFGLLVQVVLYAFLQEKPGTKWIVLSFGIFAILPVLALAPLEYLWNHTESSTKDYNKHSIVEMSAGVCATATPISMPRPYTSNSAVTLGPETAS